MLGEQSLFSLPGDGDVTAHVAAPLGAQTARDVPRGSPHITPGWGCRCAGEKLLSLCFLMSVNGGSRGQGPQLHFHLPCRPCRPRGKPTGALQSLPGSFLYQNRELLSGL